MKVSDIMSRNVEHVDADATVADACRIIFGKGINGLPVVERGKLVGFITERDILKRFFPTVGEYMEDPINTSDFEEMENKVSSILQMRISKIMSKNITTVEKTHQFLKHNRLCF